MNKPHEVGGSANQNFSVRNISLTSLVGAESVSDNFQNASSHLFVKFRSTRISENRWEGKLCVYHCSIRPWDFSCLKLNFLQNIDRRQRRH